MSYWVHSAPDDDVPTDGQRPCARDQHCSERDHKNQPRLGPRAYCSTDHALIGRCLDWLPTAYVELHMRLGEKASGQGEKVTTSSTPSIPLNLAIDTTLTDMVGLLAGWAERVRDVAQLAAGPTNLQGDGIVLNAAVRTLSAHLDALLALPPEPMPRYLTLHQAEELLTEVPGIIRGEDVVKFPDLSGADAGLEILSLHSRARSMLGLNPKHEHVPIPCWNPDCEMRSVVRWDGQAGLADEATCRSCGETYTHDRYQRLMAAVDAAQQTKTRRQASLARAFPDRYPNFGKAGCCG